MSNARVQPSLGTYEKLLSILARHLSHTHARMTLDRSLRAAGLSEKGLAERDLPILMPRIKHTARFFLDARRLDAFERDLGQVAASSDIEIKTKTIPIREEADIVGARAGAREICAALGATMMSSQKITTVVSEFARNIVSYTPGGEIVLIPMKNPPRVLVRATDTGKGIPNLDTILSGGYKSKTGLGRGILGSKKLADRMDIQTGDEGTRIEAVLRI